MHAPWRQVKAIVPVPAYPPHVVLARSPRYSSWMPAVPASTEPATRYAILGELARGRHHNYGNLCQLRIAQLDATKLGPIHERHVVIDDNGIGAVAIIQPLQGIHAVRFRYDFERSAEITLKNQSDCGFIIYNK